MSRLCGRARSTNGRAVGKRRNNPDAVARIVDLLKAFRTNRAPILHIRHEGTTPNSSFLPSRSGYAVKDEAREQDGEPAMTLSNLNDEFARIVTTDDVVASFAAK